MRIVYLKLKCEDSESFMIQSQKTKILWIIFHIVLFVRAIMQIILIDQTVRKVLDCFSFTINFIEDAIVLFLGIKHFYYFVLKKREKHQAIGQKITLIDNIYLAWFTIIFVSNGAHVLLFAMIRIHNFGNLVADNSLLFFGYIWTPIFLALNSTSVIYLFYYAASN